VRKELLIVCDEFPPAFAPRMGYLCKNLPKQEWHATVVTEKGELTSFDIDVKDADVYAYDWLKCEGKKSRYVEWLLKFFLTLVFDYKNRWFLRKMRKSLKGKHFDAVLCSSYNEFPLNVGLRYAKRRGVPCVCDIRDLAEQGKQDVFRLHQINGILGKMVGDVVDVICKKRRNWALKNATDLISVSPWHVDYLKRYNGNSHLIFNGYDDALFRPIDIRCDTFKITYTGRMMDKEIRNPELLFEALRDMKDECEKMEVEWWCDEKTEETVKNMAEEYGVQTRMRYRGFARHNEMPRVLNEASIVLVLSNKTKEIQPHGVMTTKYFEAIGCERPVLLVRSDEAELSQHIRNMGSGVACRTKGEVLAFLREKYEEWVREGRTSISYLQDKSVYSREKESRQFVEIIERAIHTDTNIQQ